MLSRPLIPTNNKKPVGKVRLNRDHWLAPCLTFFAPMCDPDAAGVLDLISGETVALPAGITYEMDHVLGPVTRWNGSTTGASLTFSNSIGGGAGFGAFWEHFVSDTAGFYDTVIWDVNASGSSICNFAHVSNFYRCYWGAISDATFGVTANDRRSYVTYRRQTGANGNRLFRDGFSYAAGSNFVGAATTGAVRLWGTAASAGGRVHRLGYLAIFDIPDITTGTGWDAEAARLWNDMYDLVLPEAKRTYSFGKVSSSSPQDLTGISSSLNWDSGLVDLESQSLINGNTPNITWISSSLTLDSLADLVGTSAVLIWNNAIITLESLASLDGIIPNLSWNNGSLTLESLAALENNLPPNLLWNTSIISLNSSSDLINNFPAVVDWRTGIVTLSNYTFKPFWAKNNNILLPRAR